MSFEYTEGKAYVSLRGPMIAREIEFDDSGHWTLYGPNGYIIEQGIEGDYPTRWNGFDEQDFFANDGSCLMREDESGEIAIVNNTTTRVYEDVKFWNEFYELTLFLDLLRYHVEDCDKAVTRLDLNVLERKVARLGAAHIKEVQRWATS